MYEEASREYVKGLIKVYLRTGAKSIEDIITYLGSQGIRPVKGIAKSVMWELSEAEEVRFRSDYLVELAKK